MSQNLPGVCVLHSATVVDRFDVKRVRVGYRGRRNQHRTNRSGAVKACIAKSEQAFSRSYKGMKIFTFGKGPLRRVVLLGASTDVVTGGVTEHVLQCLLFRDVSSGFRKDDRQFRFVVLSAVLCNLGDIDCCRVWAA